MDIHTEDQENARTDENLTVYSGKMSSVSLDNDNNSTGLQSMCSRSKLQELGSINPFMKESLQTCSLKNNGEKLNLMLNIARKNKSTTKVK